MRVLHVLRSVAPRYGGPSTTIWPLVESLNRRPGLMAEVVATDVDGPDRLDPSALPSGVPTRLFPGIGRGRFCRSPALTQYLREAANEAIVVHLHGLWNPVVSAAAAVCQRAGVPYLLRPAGMLSAYSWDHGWARKRAYWWAADRATVRGAAAIHVTSRTEADEVWACGVKAPVVVLPHGLAAEAFTTPARPDWLRERCGPTVGSRSIVLFLSRLHPKKGLAAVLVPAVARLPGEPFLAVVGGPDELAPRYETEIRRSIARHGLAARTALLGQVEPADRWAAFDGAAVLGLPSAHENFGVVVPEALARGCPAVVSDRVAAGEYVAASGAGAVVAPTVEAVAAALEAELNDPAGRSARGAAGRSLVRERLTWDTVATELHALYGRLVAQTLEPGCLGP